MTSTIVRESNHFNDQMAIDPELILWTTNFIDQVVKFELSQGDHYKRSKSI